MQIGRFLVINKKIFTCSEFSFLQNVYFGFFIFGKLTE